MEILNSILNPDGAYSLTSAYGFFINALETMISICLWLILSFFVRKMIRKFFTSPKKIASGYDYETASSVLRSIVRYVAYGCILFEVLSLFGVSPASILAVAGIGSVVIGLGAKSLVEDVISGVSILVENQFRIGDIIEIDGRMGVVESIGLRITRIRSADGDVHIFPNSTVKIVTNMSKEFNRAVIEVPVAYDEDIDKVLGILRDEMAAVKQGNKELLAVPEVLGITRMDEACVIVKIIADCDTGANWSMEREILFAIKTRFAKEGVSAPYTHKVVHNYQEG